MSETSETILQLPDVLRSDLKDPLGPIHPDMSALLDEIDGALITVGDVVSYQAMEAGRIPAVAIIDGQTKRSAVDPEIEQAISTHAGKRLHATNPAGEITQSMLDGIVAALACDTPTQLVVDGEEDLAALPVILAAPVGAHVLYGQPDAGVVHVLVNDETKERVQQLLQGMDGDVDQAIGVLTD